MLKKTILAIALAATSLPSLADSNSDLKTIIDNHWQNAKAEKIFFRTDPDGWKPNGTLPDWSEQAIAKRQAYNNSVLKNLASIDPKTLNSEQLMNYRLFKYERETEQQSYLYQDKYFPVNFLSGWHTYFAEAPANMAFLTAEDYDAFLVSLGDYPRFNQQNINLLKQGIQTGFTHYCETFKNYGQSISAHIVKQPENSALYEPFTRIPNTFSAAQKETYQNKAKALIASKVVPAYEHFYDFFENEYMPHCRAQPGIASIKGGLDYYKYTVNYYTTTNATPKQIHELGLKEVARIKAQMQSIIDEVGFDGSYSEFLEFLATDEQFYATDPQDLLEKTAFITQKMYGKLPTYFGHLPRNTFTIKGSASRGAFYMPPPDNRSPGTYFLASTPKLQPLYNLEALSLHEAIPGHHLQNAIAMELDVPEFRRTLSHSAFGEGWALYTERLGKEAGFYQSPYSDFGRLGYEMWRAVRLVVDTGIHAFGWSRQKAIDYLADHTALPQSAVEDQIDRYISWPGQALSYKMGEIKIRELRAKAEKQLGAQFDIRSFHDTVIGQGSLPMAVLEDVINDWIAQQKSAI
ncbi:MULTISPECIES: DUF885 domain-containing protein [Pseudoalteromonas]|uniref:DUF885 domain-containing protein n=1 Tax=Pseudoalteromonas tetraodonis TaxID=43659 RepID=A0ABD4ESX2_9GAMM|nr:MULTISPECIES: DUF885 domain-containing protein [Pseudoalteromonas]KYL36563.1 hypothetical protein A2I96_09180 [Pseudoalteromonas spiralis]MDN3395658.1 DUF885 domain-containing protein [Pseudoalteromonas sp. APC 3215]MDN3399922.1 DUF885 domain-containing protein [Pseudoalteromonas sp. APC 3213]MDN3406519.1 DUF885 domain-containing protein [Pseudoalteromonas sp. APC 3218]MDN3409974.1 DUF885 domain-containing protein [Pseudoalteromonas sp. APC 3894]|tara:strand:- start:68505 stop:70232 length:1728 start_codon:yes stop_codon:yes gene_type:complete